jgi:capsular polysaccharide biosynthesis protein
MEVQMDSATVISIGRAMRRRWWLALLVFFAVIAADAVFTARTPRSYQARSDLLIGPSTSIDPGQLVYSVDALGRSMIVGTYANMLGTDVVRRDALVRAGIAPDQPESEIQIKSAALADSAVVQVTAVARDSNVAAAVANAVGEVGELRMRQLYPMYDLTVVTQATPPTTMYRPDVVRNLSLGVLLGLLLGVASAWIYDSLASAR